MSDSVLAEFQKELDVTVSAMKRDLGKLRTGRASTALIEDILVDYYGTPTVLKQIANVSVPEPRLLAIQAYDQTAINSIEKSILKADLGLTPANDGKLIRVPIPQLSEERRKDLVKQVRKVAEEFRVSARNHRRTAIEQMKELQKNKEITEDAVKKYQEQIQKLTTECIVKIDGVLKNKEEEIMEV
jgi:ribosome recycling factor